MSDMSSKLVQWFLYALLTVSALLGVLFYVDVVSADILLYWGYALLAFIVVVTLVAAAMNLIRNPKGSFKVLIGLAIMVVVGVVAYSLSKNTFTPTELETYKITATTSRLVGAGLYLTYFLAIVAILAIIVTSISRLFK